MNIDEFVAVSGKPGLFRMVNNKSNGMVVENLDNGKVSFASLRKHNFNPIASIGIYVTTEEDTLNLKEVFIKMLEGIDKNPVPGKKASNDELTGYLAKVLPAFDKERVYPSDIKKLVKWFSFLNDKKLLSLEEEETDEKVKKKMAALDKKDATKKVSASKSTGKGSGKKGASKVSAVKKSGK